MTWGLFLSMANLGREKAGGFKSSPIIVPVRAADDARKDTNRAG